MRRPTGSMLMSLSLTGGCFSEHQDIDDKHSRAETGTDSGTETDETGSPTAGDADGDGVTAEAGDCNDADHTIHPGASEILDDGIDQDCDGVDAVTCNGDYLYADAAACGVITGDLLISTDAMTLDGLGGLTHIGGNLTVIGNAATSFSLDGLTHVGGNLSIHDNPSLVSFSLAGLTGVGLELRVTFNDSLSSFSLASLADIGDSLVFWYNASLCQSQVDALVQVLQALGLDGTSLYVEHNADC